MSAHSDSRAGRDAGAGGRGRPWTAFLVVASLFLAMRLAALPVTWLLENSDSLEYVKTLEIIAAGGEDLRYLKSTMNLPFPLLGAMIHRLSGLDSTTSARMVSILASLGMLGALWIVGGWLGGRRAAVCGSLVLLLSVPTLYFSISVLTEPLYVGFVYGGMTLLLGSVLSRTTKAARSAEAVLAGFLCGAAFATRVEGILLLVLVPVWFVVLQFGDRRGGRKRGEIARWITIYLLAFSAVAALQVAYSSVKAGKFLLNGRQLWAGALGAQVEAGYDELFYGLWFSDDQVNMIHLVEDPETVQSLPQPPHTQALAQKLRLIVHNTEALYESRLVEVGGLFPLILAAGGLWWLRRPPNGPALMFVAVTFLGAMLFPAVQYQISDRYLLVALPAVALLAGLGLTALMDEAQARFRLRPWITAGLVLSTLLALAVPNLVRVYRPRETPSFARAGDELWSYDDMVERFREENRARDASRIAIASRKGFFPFHVGAEGLSIPYTDYDGLIRYLRLNEAEFVFMAWHRLAGFPFATEWPDRWPADFELVDRSADGAGFELYRVRGHRAAGG